jgi:hypothetical protein
MKLAPQLHVVLMGVRIDTANDFSVFGLKICKTDL